MNGSPFWTATMFRAPPVSIAVPHVIKRQKPSTLLVMPTGKPPADMERST